jgi:hypothetical protein
MTQRRSKLTSLAEEMPAVFRDRVRVQDRLDASLQSDDLFKHAHPFGNLAPTAQGNLVGDPHLGQKAGACSRARIAHRSCLF